MNTRGFLQRLNNIVDPGRRDIIEKDFYIHRLLDEISEDEYLSQNLVFKGGSCLVKGYTGYYRFSEDIDFTWRETERWKGLSSNQIRKRCSEEINTIIEKLDQIAQELELDFKPEKGNSDYVDIGGGGRMPRFYTRYQSEMINMPSMIKIEVNFVDKTLYPYKEKELGTFIEGVESEELSFLFEDCWDAYNKPIKITCYDPREIYTDKSRALMTRMVYKLRDSIDLYILENRFGYDIGEFKEEIMEKTQFMLDLYKKYRENLKKEFPRSEEIRGDEAKLLIQSLPDDAGDDISVIHDRIERIRKKLKNKC